MDNIKDLRNTLIDVFNSVKDGKMENKKVKSLVSVASKIIQSTKIEMEYVKMIKSTRKIDFLETEKKPGRPRKDQVL